MNVCVCVFNYGLRICISALSDFLFIVFVTGTTRWPIAANAGYI